MTYSLTTSSEHNDGFIVIDVLDVAARGGAGFDVVVVDGPSGVALHISFTFATGGASSGGAGSIFQRRFHFGCRWRR